MACAKVISQFELLGPGDAGRRREWSDEEKIRIVEESFRGHRQGSATARRHGISRSLLTLWRRAYRENSLVASPEGFMAVSIAPDPAAGAMSGADADARIEIVLTNGRRILVPAGVDPGSLARLLPVLERA
ncbi:IS66-like element accessory protein TnpA [Mangrovicoccus ximenensis]|uniref:IS66-like element accessory protein TnpA n=1 Tax=Mangrovicoccus ximenensis TaxID=1911570 RepID=UPI000D3CB8D4|nr:transposase [Mangrovicoccus ximenensis]